MKQKRQFLYDVNLYDIKIWNFINPKDVKEMTLEKTLEKIKVDKIR